MPSCRPVEVCTSCAGRAGNAGRAAFRPVSACVWHALCFPTTPAREVSVGKRKVTENKTVTGTVRKTAAVVESTGGAKVRQTSKPGKK